MTNNKLKKANINKRSIPSVTLRSIVIGLAVLPINVYWMSVAELKYGSQATALPLFIYPVFLLLLLTLVNLAARRLWKKVALQQGELLTIYIMLVISTSLAAYGMLQDFFAIIPHPYQFATSENDWESLFFRYIPSWFTISDHQVLANYYEGDSTLYLSRHLKAWMKPALAWGGFIFSLTFVMLCINAMVRKRWVEQERLAFPVIQLPVAMTRSGDFFKNRLLWLGFGIVALLSFINGLHALFPVVPGISLKLTDVSQLFTEKPWNAMGRTLISFYPFMIGIAFFLPLDLSLSCWLFYVLRQLSKVLISFTGFQSMPSFPYYREQSVGAWVGFFLIAMWLSKRHLLEVFASAFGRRKGVQDKDEAMSYRMAVFGLIGGVSGLMLFCHQAGMSVFYAWVFFAIYFIIATGITRLRAEFGAPHGFFNNPLNIMVNAIGTSAMGPQNLTIMSFFRWFNRGYRAHLMPNHLEAFKMAEATNMNNRRLSMAMMLAAVAAIIATFWIDLSLIFSEGAASRMTTFDVWLGTGTFDRLQRWIYYSQAPELIRVVFMGVGIGVMFLLRILRTRFLFWPFHPAGYLLAVSSAIDYFWFTFFLSWLSKFMILGYGKLGGYRKAIPFFLGLILGDFVMGSLWMIFGVVTQRQTYMFFI